MSMTNLLPYGLGNPELVEVQKGYFVDAAIVDDLNKLIEAVRQAGFDGELALLDAEGNPMERPADEEELMYAILTWSALPGASRHHLGTDIDVVDGKACPPGYEVQLTPAECTGMFAKFHAFLDERFGSATSFGFDRVFVPGRGKIRPEGWHIAHLPTSRKRLESFSLETTVSPRTTSILISYRHAR